MVLTRNYPTPLSGLCSEDRLELIDTINNLRPQGIYHEVSIPQLIVCGDRSSGKSSVLKAISGIPFPVGSNIWMMGISPSSIPFSRDIFRVEISGPDQPHLTLVDLPGLISPEESNGLEDANAEPIRDVVTSYMKDPRSIILAVVHRTLGIVTKPDTLIRESEREVLYVCLNQKMRFLYDWHILKNADSEGYVKATLAQRDKQEAAFMSQARAKRSLKSSELPRDSLDEQQRHLVQISDSFRRVVKGSINGIWSGPFFEYGDDAADGHGYRIRAIVQNLNRKFAHDLDMNGERRMIVSEREESDDEDSEAEGGEEEEENEGECNEGEDSPNPPGPICVTRSEFVEKFLEIVIQHVVDDDAGTATAIFQKIVEPGMNRIRQDVQEKTEHILQAYRRSHPTTYNYDLMSSMYETRTKGYQDAYSRTLKRFFEVSQNGTVNHGKFDFDAVLDALLEVKNYPSVEIAMESEVLEILEAYYEVALKRFIDVIAIEILEVRLASALPDIISPVGVYKMDPALINEVAGEPEDRRAVRAQLAKQLELLSQAALICSQFYTSE
ncbi:hypothetical protein PG993_013421 [Apiospora rasikravindrae]|uniref:GED domain-containing protein n=1 Tax=Apiospora rasikravindrae TaxID=990691 RepID=A0ABR1RZQ6_9PEZI